MMMHVDLTSPRPTPQLRAISAPRPKAPSSSQPESVTPCKIRVLRIQGHSNRILDAAVQVAAENGVIPTNGRAISSFDAELTPAHQPVVLSAPVVQDVVIAEEAGHIRSMEPLLNLSGTSVTPAR